MRTRLFVMMVAMLLVTQSLCFGETWSRSDNPSGLKVVAAEKPTAKVEIYVTDW
jgi:hypothetical protein